MAFLRYSKKDSKLIIWLFVLFLGLLAGIILIRQQQDLRENAAPSNICPGAQQCPYAPDPKYLWSCTPPDGDGTVMESICNRVGKTSFCGGLEYCCPVVNGTWTRDMTKCPKPATPPPTPVPTKSPSPIPTKSPSPIPTKSPSPSPIRTASPAATPTKSPSPSPTTSPSPTFKTGDINADGFVDIVDIGILIDNYALLPVTDRRCDLNNDNKVDVVDLGIVIDNYGL